jgi:hypothetical protein
MGPSGPIGYRAKMVMKASIESGPWEKREKEIFDKS